MKTLKKMKTLVIDSAKVSVTDLGDGTTEIFFKAENKRQIVSNDVIRAAIATNYSKERISAIRHKVGANREYSE